MTVTGKVTLSSSDGVAFEVDELVAIQLEAVMNIIEDLGTETALHFPNVTANILSRIIEYCSYHVYLQKEAVEGRTISEAEIQMFDAEVVRVDQATLFDLLAAADHLNVPNLVDLICEAVADAIKNKSVEEIRAIFNIQNDFTVEEEGRGDQEGE